MPTFDVVPSAVEGFMDALWECQSALHDCCVRSEPRAHFFDSVVADGVYGKSPAFLDAVDACVGVTALVAVSAETRCWLQAPRTTDKMYR